MATAVTLTQAAKQSWDNLAPFSTAGTLRTRLLAFMVAIDPVFVEAVPNDHPMRNWIAVLWSYATTMPATAGSWPALRPAAELLYRLCFMGQQLRNQSLITVAQFNSVLTAYNAQF